MKFALILGRLLMAAIFLLSGAMKVMQYGGQVGYATQMGVPLPQIAVAIAAAVEIGAGVCLVAGYRPWSTAWVLVAYLVPVTIIFHTNFADQNQMFHFLKNLAIIGGLMILASSHRAPDWRQLPAVTTEAERPIARERVPS